MSNYIKVNPEYVKTLLEGAAWTTANVSVASVQEAESVETDPTHVCPLCESTLEEDLSDEQILDHVEQLQDVLFTLNEGDKKGDKSDDKPDDDPDYTTGARKGDKSDDDPDDDPDYTTDARKGDKSKTHKGKKDYEEAKAPNSTDGLPTEEHPKRAQMLKKVKELRAK